MADISPDISPDTLSDTLSDTADDLAAPTAGEQLGANAVPLSLVVPADGLSANHRSLDVAATIAAQLDLPIRVASLVHHADELPARQRLLRRLTDTVSTDLNVVTTIDQGGDPSAFILDWIGMKRSMVVLSGGTTAHLIPGSITYEVLRFTPAPVMFTGPFCLDWVGPIQRILVPIDGSRRSERCFEVAAAWATATSSPVEIVTVVDPSAARAEPVVAHDVFESGFDLSTAAAFSERFGVACTGEVLHGSKSDRAAVIADIAAKVPGTIICMASRGAAQRSITLATTTSRLVHNSPVPVIVVRS